MIILKLCQNLSVCSTTLSPSIGVHPGCWLGPLCCSPFVEILVYNAYQPASWQPTSIANIPLDSFRKSLAVSTVGAFHCAQQVLPEMMERGKGTILFTGCSASLSGIAGFSDLSCGKFALRGLSQCLAREFQPLGIYVAHVIIDGAVGAPKSISQKHTYYPNSFDHKNIPNHDEYCSSVGYGILFVKGNALLVL